MQTAVGVLLGKMAEFVEERMRRDRTGSENRMGTSTYDKDPGIKVLMGSGPANA